MSRFNERVALEIRPERLVWTASAVGLVAFMLLALVLWAREFDPRARSGQPEVRSAGPVATAVESPRAQAPAQQAALSSLGVSQPNPPAKGLAAR